MGNMCGCGEDGKRNNTTIAQAPKAGNDDSGVDPGASSADVTDTYAAAAANAKNLSPHRGRKEETAASASTEEQDCGDPRLEARVKAFVKLVRALARFKLKLS